MKSSILAVFILFGLILTFQNCSPAKFDASPTATNGEDNKLIVDDPEADVPDEVADEDPPGDEDDKDHKDKDCNDKRHARKDKGRSAERDSCGDIDIEKVIVNVSHVELNSSSQVIESGMGPLDLLKLAEGFIVDVAETGSSKQIRLVLNSEGNKILTSDGREIALKTPSQQNSGLKLLVPGNIEFVAGKSYKLTASFDPSSKIVRAGPHCILKPVLKLKNVQEVEP